MLWRENVYEKNNNRVAAFKYAPSSILNTVLHILRTNAILTRIYFWHTVKGLSQQFSIIPFYVPIFICVINKVVFLFFPLTGHQTAFYVVEYLDCWEYIIRVLGKVA